MKTILEYIFLEPFPLDWLVQDSIAILLTLLVLAFIIRREKRPAGFRLAQQPSTRTDHITRRLFFLFYQAQGEDFIGPHGEVHLVGLVGKLSSCKVILA
ncbi:MAG: hypothetical protein JW726_12945 [Anaerolineales bacterium]|nr:hypothetical protein [Anaerolineales bacterium]